MGGSSMAYGIALIGTRPSDSVMHICSMLFGIVFRGELPLTFENVRMWARKSGARSIILNAMKSRCVNLGRIFGVKCGDTALFICEGTAPSDFVMRSLLMQLCIPFRRKRALTTEVLCTWAGKAWSIFLISMNILRMVSGYVFGKKFHSAPLLLRQGAGIFGDLAVPRSMAKCIEVRIKGLGAIKFLCERAGKPDLLMNRLIMLVCIPCRSKRLLTSKLLCTGAWQAFFFVLLISMPFGILFRVKRQLTIKLICAWAAPFVITMHFAGMPLCTRFRVKRLLTSEVIRA
ncbi:unnamed protein product [Penicillium viridicatum]